MRNALARTLYDLARQDARIVVLVADISPVGAMEDFRREFPDRFINVGVAEQSMIGLAAGLAQRGFRPFCYTIATFALFRNYEFIRCDLAYQNLPVTIVGMGAGLSYSTLGGTHQAVEDVAVAMACPNLTVLAPCDPAEIEACTRWCAARETGGPVYMRIGKAGEPDLTGGAPEPWVFGGLRVLHLARWGEGQACVVGYGPILSIALEVARRADVNHVTVLGCSTLAPLSAESELIRAVEWLLTLYSRIIVLEEAAGAPLAAQLRSAAAALGERAEIISLALPRTFPHYGGTRDEALAHYGLTAEAVVEKIRQP